MTAGRRTSAPAARASAWEWVQVALLAANLIGTTLCLGGYRPETMTITTSLTAALLVTHFLACAADGRPLRAADPAAVWLLPFLAYAAVNVVWVSPVRWLGWLDWIGWANAVATFWVVVNGIRSGSSRRALFLVVVALGLVAVVLAGYQTFVRPGWLMLGRRQAEQFLGRGSGPFGIPNSLAGFLLLMLPVAGALTFRRAASASERVWWGWVTLVLVCGLGLTVSRGAWLGLALACMIWPLLAAEWRWPRRLAVALAAGGAIAIAVAMLYGASPQARERLDHLARDAGELSRPILWRGAWQLFCERPVTGTGAGSYDVLFERERPPGFVDQPQWAHNDYLNTLSDYGALGLGLILIACVLIARRGAKRGIARSEDARRAIKWLEEPAVSRALGVGLLAFAFQLFVEFHLRVPALAMTFALMAALGLRRSVPPEMSSSRAARFGWLAAAAGVGLAAVAGFRLQHAEGLRHRAREALDAYARNPAGDLGAVARDAENLLREATGLSAAHAAAWADLAFARELQAAAGPNRARELAAPSEEAARRALAISAVVPEFWIRLGVALDMQRRRAEARAAFERSLALAPCGAQGWYYYAYHLSLDTKEREAALRAIANCLSLDPGNRAAEALRVKLNARQPDALLAP